MRKNKLLLVVLAVILIFSLVACNNQDAVENNLEDNLENEQLNVQIESSNWNIQFDENLLGETFIDSGAEIKNCNYNIQFEKNDNFSINLNNGNCVKGTYDVKNDKVECTLVSAEGEYSPSQDISGKIIFKVNSDLEIEILSVPENYNIRTSELDASGWVLTDETKNMSFWPLVAGIKYTRNNENQSEDTENEMKIIDILTFNKWQCYKMTDMSGKELDMQVLFGSGYSMDAGSLTFNADGTFEHIMPGISEGAFIGTYEVNNLEIVLNHIGGRRQTGTLNLNETDYEVVLLQGDEYMHFQYAPEEKSYDYILTSNTWQCYKVVDTDNSWEEVEMQEVFGSGYSMNVGSLTFNADGTFEHIMPGVTSDELPTTGTYDLLGDFLEMKYNDGSYVEGRFYVMERTVSDVKEVELEIVLMNQLSGYRMYFHPVA